MRVVDHHAFGRTVEIAQSLDQEGLAVEASEGRIRLEGIRQRKYIFRDA